MEGAITGNHEQVDFRIGGWSGAWTPAEVHEVIFAVDVQVAGCLVRFDLATVDIAFAGLEGDER